MKKTSIIVTCWNKIHFMAACSRTTIASIRAFTNPAEYELIVIETAGTKIWDGHHVLNLKDGIYIEKTMEQDQGNSADMNEGAKLATGEYLCFVENDVILHENWLPDMRYYLEHDLAEAITANQYDFSWEKMKQWKTQTYEETMSPGLQDAGILILKKDKFWESGGWNDKARKVFMWKAFLGRLNKIGARVITTNKVFISHIGGVSYWYDSIFDHENQDRIAAEEVKAMQAEGI